MVTMRTIFKIDLQHPLRIILDSNSMVVGEAANLVDEVQIVNVMMQTLRCSAMISLA